MSSGRDGPAQVHRVASQGYCFTMWLACGGSSVLPTPSSGSGSWDSCSPEGTQLPCDTCVGKQQLLQFYFILLQM